ncbi:MAG: efflux RND transporter periplasmic adaptor subunit [Myxococcales bacterium]|nr:efflux RND transporter periplasmic adaptor subunit [Myxococcales bacterium]
MRTLYLLGLSLSLLACSSKNDESAAAVAKAEPSAGAGQGSAAAGKPQKDGAKGAARRVEVAVLADATAHLDLVLPGEVEGARDATLAASLGGYVEKVFVSNGATVRSGQILARIDASTHLARLEQAKVEFAAAERELKRAQAMKDAVSKAQLDNAESRFAAAQAAKATASIAVDRAVVRAPFAGTVANVDIEVGEVAAPGAPILRLVQLKPVKVTISVSDREVSSLEEGLDVQITTGAESAMHIGKIAHINPAADARTRSFEVQITVPNEAEALKPGMIATVRVARELGGDTIIIPQDWVVTRLDGLGVFLDENGVAKWHEVSLGNVIRDQVVVRSGVQKGDRIISTGHRELVDGDPILVARSGTCCTNGRVTYE